MTNILKKAILALSTTAIVALAAPALADSDTEARIRTINAKYDTLYLDLQRDGEALDRNAPDPNGVEGAIGIEFDVEWETTSIKFDIPEVTMKTRAFKLHLPQFRMKRTSIKWDNPEFRMVLKKVGEYPCFHGWKWYSCDIKTKVPEVHMVRREAKLDLPEVFWDITSFSMDIPEFRSKRMEIKLDLPQFHAKDVDVEIGRHKERVTEISRTAHKLAAAQKSEIADVVAADLKKKRESTVAQFDTAIEAMESSIAELRKMGADPEAVTSEDGTENLVARLEEIRIKRAETLALFDEKIAEMSENISNA